MFWFRCALAGNLAHFGDREGFVRPLLDTTWKAKWNWYRLGDVVNHYENYEVEKCCKDFPGTIACGYVKNTNLASNFQVLHNITKQKQDMQKDLPGDNDIVVHLRVGDGLSGPDCWRIETHCFSHASALYALPESYYANLLPKMPAAADGVKVVLVGATGHDTRESGVRPEWSTRYVAHAVHFFESAGYKVLRRLVHSPDVDFVYMSAASTFVQGGGGYSALVAQMVLLNGKRVLLSHKLCGSNKQLC